MENQTTDGIHSKDTSKHVCFQGKLGLLTITVGTQNPNTQSDPAHLKRLLGVETVHAWTHIGTDRVWLGHLSHGRVNFDFQDIPETSWGGKPYTAIRILRGAHRDERLVCEPVVQAELPLG